MMLLFLETGRAIEERAGQAAIIVLRNDHSLYDLAFLLAGVTPHAQG
jgi:hypothetical protein